MIMLGYARCSKPSALAIAAASNGKIKAVHSPYCDINWGQANSHADLNRFTYHTVDKYRALRLFEENDVPIPLLIDFPMNAVNSGMTIVGRPTNHTHGRGFWLVHNEREYLKAIRGTRTKKAATHFMEYIDAAHELRVHVFMGKSQRISEKLFAGREGNHKLYTTIKPSCSKEAIKKARKAAKAATAAVGLDFAAVDVLVDHDDNVFVLETNCAPGIGGSLPRMYADMFIRWSEEQ